MTDHSLGFEPPADKRAPVGYGSFTAVLDALALAVAANEYIAGDQFSAADVDVVSHVGWGLDFGPMEERQVFREYVARLRDRDADHRAKQLDDAAMPAKQE